MDVTVQPNFTNSRKTNSTPLRLDFELMQCEITLNLDPVLILFTRDTVTQGYHGVHVMSFVGHMQMQ